MIIKKYLQKKIRLSYIRKNIEKPSTYKKCIYKGVILAILQDRDELFFLIM